MELSAPIAILFGACIASATSTAGSFLTSYLSARNERVKGKLEKKIDAYSNSLRYLMRVLNRRTMITAKGEAVLGENGVAEWLDDLCEAQIWLSSLQFYCSRKNKRTIQVCLDKLSQRVSEFMRDSLTTRSPKSLSLGSDEDETTFGELIQSVYADIYECARDELSL